MRLLTQQTAILTGAILTLGFGIAGVAKADQKGFCVTGKATSEQTTIDCAGRWVAADGTRFGARIDPGNTPRTAHPAYRAQGTADHHFRQTGSRLYTTHASQTPASVWTPPEAYYPSGAPVVITRGNQVNAYNGNYDVYVPARGMAPRHTACNAAQSGHPSPNAPLCGSTHAAAPIEGCFTVDAHGSTHSVPCPTRQSIVYTSASHQGAPQVMAQASASASAIANVNISSAGFFNTLSGGVGGNAPMFYGGGGSTIITGGGGSVLSRAPLTRFRSRNRGRHGGHGGGGMGCGCGGGGMMGGGGGD